MVPETSAWRGSSEYDFMDEVGVDDLAWECLRRNGEYQRDYANLLKTSRADEPLSADLSERWGYDFAARPSLSGIDEPVFWNPEIDTSVVFLTNDFVSPDSSSKTIADLAQATQRLASDGVHLLLQALSPAIHMIIQPEVSPDLPLAALVPLGADGLDRIEALIRLYRQLHHLPVPTDTRLTPQQRRRLKNMLRAADGRSNHADYREIAEVIFGVARVAADPWKTSALRDATMDLVKDGFAMIDSGYRKLLRHRRRS